MKNDKLNTARLVYNNMVWVYSGNKNTAVLAAFDINTKIMVYSKIFDEKMDITEFRYGPVEYKSSPST